VVGRGIPGGAARNGVVKTIHVIEVRLREVNGRELPGAAEFLQRFGKRPPPRATSYVFDREEEAREALGLLRKNKLTGRHFFRNELERDEIASQAALFLGIHMGSEPLLSGDDVDASQMGELDLSTALNDLGESGRS
jgi:hypothetical protein